jgi:hypothetical protein
MNDYVLALESSNRRADLERNAARERLVKMARAEDVKEKAITLVAQHLLGWGQENAAPAARRFPRATITSEIPCAAC